MPPRPAHPERRRRPALKATAALTVMGALLGTAPAAPAAPAGQAVLDITVRQLLPQQGELLVVLFDRAEGWPDSPGPALPARRMKAEGETMTLKIDGLAPGRWAVMVLQDLNGNGRVDSNFIGLPKEPYGASNNRLPRLSPPVFEEALVDVGPQGAAVTIELRRP
jgi:uncharacterized protein (DUF2141 family)